MEDTTRYPRILAVIEYGGRSWFVDRSLREFRDVQDPRRSVKFSSEDGLLMLAVHASDVATAAIRKGRIKGDRGIIRFI